MTTPLARVVAAALLLILGAGGASRAATLVVRVQNVKSDRGMIHGGVCATRFDEADCPYKTRVPAVTGTSELRFLDVKPGTYGIAVYHDLNGNEELDRTLLIPTEPLGFSNDAWRFGIPIFEDAKVAVREPETIVVLTLR